MKKIFLLFLFAIATCGIMANAATKYEINVGGVEVTSDNASHISGGDITSGYGVYNASTNTLTLYSINIYRNGQDKYGIHNRKCDNLKIVFTGTCGITVADNALKLERGTTLEAASSSKTSFYTSARICANLKSYTYYIKGSGEFYFDALQEGYEAIKGDGTGSTKVYFEGGKITARSDNRSALSSFSAYFYNGTHLVIKNNGSNASVSNVAMQFNGREAVISPYNAVYYNNSVCIGTTPIAYNDIIISDDYVAILNSSYFPDVNFRNALYNLYPKGYINSSDVESCTTLNVSGKNISNLTGLGYFTKLTYLSCTNNNLTSLPSLPSSLKYLYCGQNNLTSLPSLPNSLETLSCNNNKFTSLSVTGRSALSYLDCSNNTSLTTLYCYNNALTTLKVTGCSAMTGLYCNINKLTSLDLNGCTNLAVLSCWDNLITTLSSLPTSLEKVYCHDNMLSGTLDLSNRSKLEILECSSNPNLTKVTTNGSTNLETLYAYNCANLTELDCRGTSTTSGKLQSLNLTGLPKLVTLNCNYQKLTSLNLSSCTSLKTLECSNNLLTSMSNIPNSIEYINCCNNKFTTLTVINKPALKTLYCNNNSELTTLNAYDNSALTTLGVASCTALTTMYCYNNSLTGLALTTLKNLTYLSCHNNKLTTLSTTLNYKLEYLYAYRNQLTELSVQGLSSLKTIECQENKLTDLYVQGCTSLRTLRIFSNQIKISGMQTLVNSLPTIPSGSTGRFEVYEQGDPNEGNVITDAQVQVARNKRWLPYKSVDGVWVEIGGGLYGDVNCDGSVNAADVTALYNFILNGDKTYLSTSDVNNDDAVNAGDVTAVYNIILGQN